MRCAVRVGDGLVVGRRGPVLLLSDGLVVGRQGPVLLLACFFKDSLNSLLKVFKSAWCLRTPLAD